MIYPEAPKNRARRMLEGTDGEGGEGGRVRVSSYCYRESDPERTTDIKPIKTAEPRRQEMTVINSAL